MERPTGTRKAAYLYVKESVLRYVANIDLELAVDGVLYAVGKYLLSGCSRLLRRT